MCRRLAYVLSPVDSRWADCCTGWGAGTEGGGPMQHLSVCAHLPLPVCVCVCVCVPAAFFGGSLCASFSRLPSRVPACYHHPPSPHCACRGATVAGHLCVVGATRSCPLHPSLYLCQRVDPLLILLLLSSSLCCHLFYVRSRGPIPPPSSTPGFPCPRAYRSVVWCLASSPCALSRRPVVAVACMYRSLHLSLAMPPPSRRFPCVHCLRWLLSYTLPS